VCCCWGAIRATPPTPPTPPPAQPQGYPGRPALLRFHAPWLAWRLLGAASPWGAAELLRAQRLLHGSGARREQPAFLAAWAPALVPALALLDDADGAALVAGGLGVSPAQLVSHYYRQCVATFFPLAQVGRGWGLGLGWAG
jgi:hypothetical protein